ncbi:ATP-binding protein [Desulfovibrio aminophilus]|nr:ATP-binding protein [Desulfovibrio aminophilus]MCM0755677.1 ATP-binding protein [Desulfovibrio aminophilus]
MQHINIAQDFEGRIDNLNWTPSTSWDLPILEAISNSLHATQYIDPNERIIEITLIREGDDQLTMVTDKQKERPIVGFRVQDNGEGFNDDNFSAFKRLDTRHKRKYGGKGIGRLFWLKAFNFVKIDSVYNLNGETFQRNIIFKIDGIDYNSSKLTSKKENKTIVEVTGIKPQYKRYYKRLSTTLAKNIADEFLPYFILNGWPRVLTTSFTGVGEGLVSVKDTTNYIDQHEKFRIKGIDFSLIHIKNYKSDKHSVHYCASNRVVSSFKSEATVNLPKKYLFDSTNTPFMYMGLVLSEYLDTNVSAERNAFLIPLRRKDVNHADMLHDIVLEDVDDEIKIRVSNFLRDSLAKAQTETIKSVHSVLSRNPELRYVNYSDDDISKLVSATESDITNKFRQMLYEQLDNSRCEMTALLERLGDDKIADFSKFETEFHEEVEKFSLLNQSHVVSYILFRQHVIKLFEKAITTYKNDKVKKESFIHNLIFPMRKQGRPADFGTHHNLWLIDDRLSLVDWIASDLPIAEHKVLHDVPSEFRPDIVFYNLAYADNADAISSSGYSEVHIVELKRPFTLSNNPVQQIRDYIYELRNGKCSHLIYDNGDYVESKRKVHLSDNTIFYGYVVFDLSEVKGTDRWNKIVFNDLKQYMNGYVFIKDNITIFVNSFENILEIAKKRNEAFYSKLINS